MILSYGLIKFRLKNSNKNILGMHESTNENGLRLVDFAAGRLMAIKSTYFMHKRLHLQTYHSQDGHTFNQIDHCFIDGRHFSDVKNGVSTMVCKLSLDENVKNWKKQSRKKRQTPSATRETSK
jgi:hypothetical protein